PLLHCFFFFNPPPTTELSTHSLHDALPISAPRAGRVRRVRVVDRWRGREWRRHRRPSRHNASVRPTGRRLAGAADHRPRLGGTRSEEHTSELQSRENLVCRLLLEKKETKTR